MMGGAYFEVGNITPAAEFNIYVDPQAADVVFRSGIPITVAPLDLTHRMLTTEARRQAFAGIGNRTGEAVAGLLSFSERFDLDQIRQHRRAAARSLRHRLAAQAGAVRGPRDQCQHRDGRAS